MLKNQLIISIAYLALIIPADGLLAQDVPKLKTLVSDGPYEIEGDRGVIGFIVATAGASATFQPCTGSPFEVEVEKLKRTSLTCDDEAPPDIIPVINPIKLCEQQQASWSMGRAELMAMPTIATVGTAWVGSGAIAVLPAHTILEQLANSVGLATCGDFLVVVDKKGEALANIIQTKNPLPAQ